MVKLNSIDSFIGQKDIKNIIQTNIKATQLSGLTFPHTLFKGPPGFGKTTFAKLIAQELGYPFISLLGSTIDEDGCELMFVDLKPNTIVFIDETHAMPKVLTEFLYPVMEDFTIHIGQSTYEMPPFTLIGATTNPELLVKPLRDRFKLNVTFGKYTNKELMGIGEDYAGTLNLRMDKSALLYLSKVCHGIPRVLKNYIDNIHRYEIVYKFGRISLQTSVGILKQMGVDYNGLRVIDTIYLKYLKYTYVNTPVSASTMIKLLNVNKKYMESDVESFLLEHGYISITPRGRIITAKGCTVV